MSDPQPIRRHRSDLDADIVVVGGGVMGTSIAYFLASTTELEITLVERETFAAGSTGDSSAIVRHHYGPQEHYTKMAKWSRVFYEEFEQRTGEVIAFEPCPYVKYAVGGTTTDAYTLAGYDVLQEQGIPVSKFEGDFGERFPELNLSGYDTIVVDEAAWFSDGADVANGFARAAASNGVAVWTGSVVESITVEGDRVTGVRTDIGRISSQGVVCAAGPWNPPLLETIEVDLPLSVSREQVLILDPPEGFYSAGRHPVPTFSLPGGKYYLRPDFGGGVLAATHHTADWVDPDRYDRTPDERTILELTDILSDVVPALKGAGLQSQYCGLYTRTPDHDFILDSVGPDGCYLAAGFSGHGFKHGPTIGRLMTDLITQGTSDFVDLGFFSADRFAEDPDGHGRPDDLA
jgi:glycine/D-amino acid oxidase-like deaminating enzyme